MIAKANCKINIGLDVLRRRADGFHDLATVMFPVRGLYDTVEVTACDEVQFVATGLAVDCPAEENLCLRAYHLMRAHYGVGGVRIKLDKRVPFGAGLGGGSSDATAVIRSVNDLFELRLSEAELIARAAELGSDTAFFVRNTPQYCTGRGEVLSPISLDLAGRYLVIIKPDGGISTREAYAGVTPALPPIPLRERLMQDLSLWQQSIKNDFEPSVFRQHPAIALAKQQLLACGALYASMSGSGSAVYGIFDCAEKSEKLQRLSPFVYQL
ncbi:MAG: 4-(cytidine 5'-diphospho)-2-C-methyl-D-erythritol kinase [Alistipes sp.]